MRGFAFRDGVGDPAIYWRKSSRSWGNGNCVEVAGLPGKVVGVRDSKSVEGADMLRFTPAQWSAFVRKVRNGE